MGASQSIRKSYEPYIPSTAFQTKLYPNSQLMGNSTYTKMRFETDPATGDNPNFNETNSLFYGQLLNRDLPILESTFCFTLTVHPGMKAGICL